VVGDRRANDDDLVLPHPKAHERAFVLAPWNDVEPDAELLDQGPVVELLAKAGEQTVTRRDDLVLNLQ
jgi:2-amino-4-hydroxy-6-hydroxymethyldihydropteridine diphosphokinase